MDGPKAPAGGGAGGWNVELRIEEDETRTKALLNLSVGSRRLQAHGMARRNPEDPNLPRVGDDLAVSRALSQMAHDLLNDAVAQLEDATARPAGIRDG